MPGVVDRETHLLMLNLWIVEHLPDIQHLPAGHPGSVQHRDPVVDPAGAGHLVDLGVDGGTSLEAVPIGDEIGMITKPLKAQRGKQLRIDRIVAGRDRHLAIGRFEQTVRCDQPVIVTVTLGNLAGCKVVGCHEGEHAHHAVGQRGADLLALPGSAAPDQRCQHAHRRV